MKDLKSFCFFEQQGFYLDLNTHLIKRFRIPDVWVNDEFISSMRLMFRFCWSIYSLLALFNSITQLPLPTGVFFFSIVCPTNRRCFIFMFCHEQWMRLSKNDFYKLTFVETKKERQLKKENCYKHATSDWNIATGVAWSIYWISVSVYECAIKNCHQHHVLHY